MVNNWKRETKSWIKAILIAGAIFFIVRTVLFAPYRVDGFSMEPTLHNEEKIFVSKFKTTKLYERGNIVVISGKDGVRYVKRIIALPGDKIKMLDDRLLINGKETDEPYLEEYKKSANLKHKNFTGNFGPINVPNDQYFVMGDNRINSMDSRNGLGMVYKDEIIGESKYVFYPVTNFRVIH